MAPTLCNIRKCCPVARRNWDVTSGFSQTKLKFHLNSNGIEVSHFLLFRILTMILTCCNLGPRTDPKKNKSYKDFYDFFC